MAEAQTVEGEFTVPQDGLKLYTKTWKAAGDVKAIVIFIHGFSDHCNAYGEFFPRLTRRGIEVRSFDQRGWGRSVKTQADRGLTGPTAKVLLDMTEFISAQLSTIGKTPLFLMGHSMGGGEVLHWLADPVSLPLRPRIRGYLFESPFVAFHSASKPWSITVAAGRLAGRVLPRWQLHNPLDPKLLSRSIETQQAYLADPLCHHTGTLEGLAGLLDRAGDLDGGRVHVPVDAGEGGATRIWIAHGTIDGACSYEGTRNFYERLSSAIKDKELKTYDGWSHKLHGEPSPDAETFAEDTANWILARSGPLETLGGPITARI